MSCRCDLETIKVFLSVVSTPKRTLTKGVGVRSKTSKTSRLHSWKRAASSANLTSASARSTAAALSSASPAAANATSAAAVASSSSSSSTVPSLLSLVGALVWSRRLALKRRRALAAWPAAPRVGGDSSVPSVAVDYGRQRKGLRYAKQVKDEKKKGI